MKVRNRRGSIVLVVGFVLVTGSAFGQTLNDSASQSFNKDARLFVELGPGSTSTYDRNRDVIILNGDVKLYFDGRILEADSVVYDRKLKRVFAKGNTRITEKDGTKYFSDRFEVTDDFKDGFVDHFRALTLDNQRISAVRAERTDDEQTIFERGIYTPCLPCAANPEKAPLWQVKSKRMISKNKEQMLYFEDAQIEFWGVPVAYLPFFSVPDPSVRRKTGFLAPSLVTDPLLGFGVSTPYYFALAPNFDLTITPTLMTRQGLLLQGEWRHRLETGTYDVTLAGIYQLDPKAFPTAPNGAGNRAFRGSIRTSGNFAINDKWTWGWDASISTDRYFYKDYNVRSSALTDVTYLTDSTSSIYLNGQGSRSWFDLRGYYFQARDAGVVQEKIPVVLPSFEYDRKFETPIGAELGVRVNAFALARDRADLQALRLTSPAGTGCLTSIGPNCSIVNGMAGTYSRVTAELTARKSYVDGIGQVWTPFASADVSMSGFSLSNDGTANNAQQEALFGANSDKINFRFMPTIGLDYRYPLFAATDFGTHIIEPIAQIVASPNETKIGRLPNEDAQSLTFDDTNLFDWSRFSGDDRKEGGVRANLGLQYTWNLPNGGWLNMMGGRSFHLAGQNSFSPGDSVNTGLNSGLNKTASDYVARVSVQPTSGVALSLRGRFDPDSLKLKRIEGLADLNFNRLNFNATYARFEPQPLLGFDRIREGLSLNASIKITDYWRIYGATIFDLDIGAEQKAAGKTAFNDKFQIANASLGIGYLDECTDFSISWSRANSLTVNGIAKTNDTFMFKLGLKNLTEVGYTHVLGPK